MGTININIVIQVDEIQDTYLDIVYDDLNYSYKPWVPTERNQFMYGTEDDFTHNDGYESYSQVIASLGDPCITLIKYEE